MDHLELNKIIEAITKPYMEEIVALKANLVASQKKQQDPFRSVEIKELATALAKAQGEMNVADLNKSNPFFKSKYADLMSVVQASRPALSKYGLSVVQSIIHQDDGASTLYTILLHTSGQYIESRMRIIPPKNDIQTISSYTTYLKRMAYASLIVVTVGEEDDDAEISMTVHRDAMTKGTALNTNYNPRENPAEVVSADQYDELQYELEGYGDISEMILLGLKIQSLKDMPKQKYQASINRIREIKLARSTNKR